MLEKFKLTSGYLAIFQVGVIFSTLLFTSWHSYLLFHSLVEIFSVVVSFGIFVVAWNSRRYIDNHYFLLLGIAYLFVGLLDTLHLLSYEGMGVVPGSGVNLSTQLWLAVRYLTAITLVVAPFFVKRKIDHRLTVSIYLAVFSWLVVAIFYWKIFPVTYNYSGLTNFKIGSEYMIAAFFTVAALHLHLRRHDFNHRVYRLLLWFTVLELTTEIFLFGVLSTLGWANMASHFIKVGSFYLLYLGVVETGLMKPYRLLFKNLKDSEEALKDSEERYRLLVELSPDAMIVHDFGKMIFVNHSAVAILGVKSEKDLVGKNLLSYFHPDFQDIVANRISQMQSGKRETPLREMRLVTHDGRVLDVEVVSVLVSYRGKTSVQTIIRDITARKLAFEDASDHVVITDKRGKIVYANKAAEEMTGFSRAEMIGRSPSLWGSLVDRRMDMSRGEKRCAWDLIKQGNVSFIGEISNQRKTGEKYIADLHISPVYDADQNVSLYIWIERDITKLKEIDHAKTEFTSLASHQLRTPIAGISLAAELLLRNVAGPLEEKQRKYVKEIYDRSKEMTELVDALLNLSRIELGTFKINHDEFNLVDYLNTELEGMRLQINSKNIKLHKSFTSEITIVKFDRKIISMIFENLLSNAIRYSYEGGEVFVSLEKRAGDILFTVKDFGCGIPQEDQAKIFRKFFRANNATHHSVDGSGLGLFIVKAMLNRVGGKIWLESSEGVGSSFYVAIPLDRLGIGG
ncbi:PAS domain S-box protein [Candidatus Falkowbacteria bacterium]|nr:PAS domain S-box protein [Candidatus Falkowbacteria bacterium]